MSRSAAPPALLLDDGQRLDWLRLIRSENVGPATFRALINRYGGAAEALRALPDLARRGGKRDLKIASRAEVEREYAGVHALGARLVALGEQDYPEALRHVEGAPPLLALRGRLALARRPAIAIVGSREASAAGRSFTRLLARDLGRAGFVIVSGLARGIDAAAHAASLPTGTIAVLAGGLDRVYPPEHAGLLARIAEEGLLASEMPLGWTAQARDFPRRNRIVAGMARGVVVVEAAERSGTLITARLAGEYGRDVFAVPGSPLDPRSAGTNRLLKQGAVLVTEAADVIEALAPTLEAGPTPAFSASDEDGYGEADPPQDVRTRLVAALGPSPVALDDLMAETGAPPGLLHLVLVELDLAGRLERHAGGRVSLMP